MTFNITSLDSEFLKQLLGDTTGLSNFTTKFTGNRAAFGKFQDDPFNLKSGVVLSTGKVSDLVGKNISDGGFSPGKNIKLEFQKLDGTTGVSNDTAIYRADLSKLGIDIQSLLIADSNSKTGGAEGKFSGFDLDAIKVSNTLVNSAKEVNTLPSLNIFDFTPTGIVLSPGTQRPLSNPDTPVQTELNGVVNGTVNNSIATLNNFDANGSIQNPSGAFSLGDGGKIGFNLKNTLTQQGNPLYLYIGESGNNGEVADGNISVSNRPISGLSDLSTDFGSPGEVDDYITLQIDFDADSTNRKIFFEYVFGSEEFAEFAGQFNDSFRLELNGLNLAKLSNNNVVTINNLAQNPFDRSNPDFIYNPADTGPSSNLTPLDGYTKPIIFSGDLIPNARNRLTINVKDNRDGLLDSVVFLKGGTLGITPPDGSKNIPGGDDNPPPTDDGKTPSADNNLTNIGGTIFIPNVNESQVNLQFTIDKNSAAFNNEFGIFVVDNEKGEVNGIAPDSAGYLQAAMKRSQVVFSTLANDPSSKPSERIINFIPNTYLSSYLVQNASTDEVLASLAVNKPTPNVFFSNAVANTDKFDHIQIQNISDGSISMGWEDFTGGGDKDFDDPLLSIKVTKNSAPLGNTPQVQRELINLRGISDKVTANLISNSEAIFDNTVGFYTIDDLTGRIGNLRPEDTGYAQAALERSIIDIQRDENFNQQMSGGDLLAPFIITNGNIEQFLSQNSNNNLLDGNPLAYFVFLEANPDKVDHIRLLGDNKFGFEDLYGGGDRDYNDIVLQVNFTSGESLGSPISPMSVFSQSFAESNLESSPLLQPTLSSPTVI